LEEEAGVSPKKICYAHGSLHWATCCKCKRKVSSKEIEDDILRGTVPYCQVPVVVPTNAMHQNTVLQQQQQQREPSARLAAAAAISRKRSRSVSTTSADTWNVNNEEYYHPNPTVGKNGTTVCGGVMKPGVTFFGEALHNTVKNKLQSDRGKVDALIVIGTSLSV
jgi:NAD-dependent SIR2 family protein deacetylase